MGVPWKLGVKILVQGILFLVFIKYFGLGSWQRFNESDTVITSHEKEDVEIPSPGITICMSESADTQSVEQYCLGKDGKDLVKCIETSFFNVTSIIKKEKRGTDMSPDSTEWKTEYNNQGFCFTLDTQFHIGIFLDNETIRIELNKTKRSLVFIHDPNFYVFNTNRGFPMSLIIAENDTMMYQQMTVVEHRNLDLPHKPCNPSPAYSFTGCVKQVFSERVGCRVPWDRWTQPSLPLCNSTMQYR
jgi:hypothetical protein